MQSTMQDIPLSVSRILNYGASVHGTTKITTWRAGTPEVTSFRAVAGRASALAHALRDELGITGDQRVATLLNNCSEHLEVLFAVTCMGAVFNPLNKNLMNDQIRHVINHAEDEVIIADPRLCELLSGILSDCPSVRAVVFTGTSFPEGVDKLPDGIATYVYEELLDARPTSFEWPALPESDGAAMCYSTGTTGAPKGVVYSQRSLYLEAVSLRTSDSMAISGGESFLCCVPIFHVLSWGVPLACFMAGAPIIFSDDEVTPESLAALISTTHPRVAHGVPTVWMQLMVHYLHHPPERMSLTEIFVGGSPAPPMLIRMWEERYGVDIIHVWGMTETSTVGTVARPPAGVSGEARWAYRVSQGRFPPALDYRVVNDGHVVSSTDRNEGEIQVRGNLVTARYYHSAAEEADAQAHEFRGTDVEDGLDKFTADGWLRTGDVGSVTSDGYLTIHDRARDVIRSGGEWIYSVALENLIMDSADVVECAVVGYPDKKWGERPLAVTVLHEGVPPTTETAQALRDQLKDSLPTWMLPEYWTFIKRIDRTSVSKFDKLDLRKHLAAGDFEVIDLNE